MIWPFSLLGALLGAWLAGAGGALLGVLLGQVVDRRLRQGWQARRTRPAGPLPLRGDELLFVLLGRLAKQGGRVDESHIRAARAEMQQRQMDRAQQLAAIRAFGRGKSGQDNLRMALERLQGQPEEGRLLLAACWRLARAPGRLGHPERELILQWGQWLGWSAGAAEALDAGREPKRPVGSERRYQEALQLLGVQADTEPAAIRLAYRRQLSRHHPDKLAGLGASPADIQRATELTRALHEAYLLVRERHGFQ